MISLDPVAVSRGARRRQVVRMSRVADARAMRRFRRWLDLNSLGAGPERDRASLLYLEAEELWTDLRRSLVGS